MKVEFNSEVEILTKEQSRLVIALKNSLTEYEIISLIMKLKAITECLDFLKNYENENGGKKDGQMAASR